ncbi:lipopolysaccharide core heptose(II) kinase RfaY [Leminorella grimontii]|uniref:lipopolysaccharide core heptose(II) kinase RfaY n=1 Tax=Leminorella grimontii TaxID=82981 RepID=UPI00321F7189
MITKKKKGKLTVYLKDNDPFYESILDDFLHFKLNVKKVFRSIEDTKVLLIDTERGKFVLKVFVPQDRKKERFFKSFVKGDYYENLILQTDRVRTEGFLLVNDYYFLAENKIFNYAKTFIMLIEYIEGQELSDMNVIPEYVKNDIASSIDTLHSHDMVSGDPHKGNFILSSNGIRLIDLSGKKCNSQRKAKDRIDLERHFGIKNEIKDVGYYMLTYKKNIRNKIKEFKVRIRSCFR